MGANVKDDRRAIPLCRGDHGNIHALTGPFLGWSVAEVQAWENRQLDIMRIKYLATLSPT